MNGYTCIILLLLTTSWAQLAVAGVDLESCALCPAAVEPVCDPGGQLTFNNRCLAECQGVLNSLPGACEGAMRRSITLNNTIHPRATSCLGQHPCCPRRRPPARCGSNCNSQRAPSAPCIALQTQRKDGPYRVETLLLRGLRIPGPCNGPGIHGHSHAGAAAAGRRQAPAAAACRPGD